MQKDLEFVCFQGLDQFGNVGFDLLLKFDLCGLWLRLTEFNHDAQIVDLLFELEQGIDFLAKRVRLFDEFLGLFAIVPKVISGH